MFPQCSIYYTSHTSTEEEHQVFFSLRGKFSRQLTTLLCAIPIIAHFYCRNSWIFGASVGSDPWTPLKLCPGDLTAPPDPPDPQLARAMTFACRHDIIKNPTNFWWWWFEGGGHMKFSQIERGDQQFFCCFQGGDQKFNRVFHPVSTTPPPPPPRELKNDNSLSLKVINVTSKLRILFRVMFTKHSPEFYLRDWS